MTVLQEGGELWQTVTGSVRLVNYSRTAEAVDCGSMKRMGV